MNMEDILEAITKLINEENQIYLDADDSEFDLTDCLKIIVN